MSYAKKHWWRSKTLIFNGISIVIFAAQGMAGVSYVPADVLLTIVAVGNAILRVVTKQPIGK